MEKVLNELLAELSINPTLRERFLRDPARLLRERGASVPAGLHLEVIEDTASTRHIVIPHVMPASEAVVEELVQRASKQFI